MALERACSLSNVSFRPAAPGEPAKVPQLMSSACWLPPTATAAFAKLACRLAGWLAWLGWKQLFAREQHSRTDRPLAQAAQVVTLSQLGALTGRQWLSMSRQPASRARPAFLVQ